MFAEKEPATESDAGRDKHLPQRAFAGGKIAEGARHRDLAGTRADAGEHQQYPAEGRDGLGVQQGGHAADEETVDALRAEDCRGVLRVVQLADGHDNVGGGEGHANGDEIIDARVGVVCEDVGEEREAGEGDDGADGEGRPEFFAEQDRGHERGEDDIGVADENRATRAEFDHGEICAVDAEAADEAATDQLGIGEETSGREVAVIDGVDDRDADEEARARDEPDIGEVKLAKGADQQDICRERSG